MYYKARITVNYIPPGQKRNKEEKNKDKEKKGKGRRKKTLLMGNAAGLREYISWPSP